jgi:hypothetical protein
LEFHPSGGSTQKGGIFRDGAHPHILLPSLGISAQKAPGPFAKAIMDRIEDIRCPRLTPALGGGSMTSGIDFLDYPQDFA